MLPRLPLLTLTMTLAVACGPVRAQDQEHAHLPGTEFWEALGDPPADMVQGIHTFLDRELEASVARRQERWERDFSSTHAYIQSIAPNRERFLRIIGTVGERVEPVAMAFVSSTESPAEVAKTDRYTVFAVRWGVYPGVDAEGLWLEPNGEVQANVVAVADCDVTPEQFVGLAPGIEPNGQVARLLAEAGCRVLVPTLIDRSDEFSGNPAVRMTNLPHREWVYRMAFEGGRHIIGYEVDKVLAAVDWFDRAGQPRLPIGVMGHGEGGLIAFYAAAADRRIDAAWVAGYFGPREALWKEPIYRNVWALLDEFGDAEIASLILPRVVLIEACRGPEVDGPPPPRDGRDDAASGRLTTPPGEQVQAEADRIAGLVPESFLGALQVLIQGDGQAPLNADGIPINIFATTLIGSYDPPGDEPEPPDDARPHFQPRDRQKRQLDQLVAYTQRWLRTSELRRYDLWDKADTSSLETWNETTEPYREHFWDEVIGRFPPASEPMQAKTRKILEEPNFTGFAVQLPVWPDVVASGVLLLPNDLEAGETRPVVVCQHGLEGTPEPIVDPRVDSVYNSYGAQLADLGYIVYAPKNPYIGRDEFRLLVRKANPLKKSLYAVIVRQHERTLQWLASLPQVDPERIAFYGLSYGGKTAMRIPALLEGYCLSICSADFNEWVVKCTNLDRRYSYMYTLEYDMYEFALSEGYNYADMAKLIAPRPFMVERGHRDGVAPDEWVAYEYAKVRRLYADLGIPERTEIEFFLGGHEIHGRGTFAFLARHLNWPRGMPPERE